MRLPSDKKGSPAQAILGPLRLTLVHYELLAKQSLSIGDCLFLPTQLPNTTMWDPIGRARRNTSQSGCVHQKKWGNSSLKTGCCQALQQALCCNCCIQFWWNLRKVITFDQNSCSERGLDDVERCGLVFDGQKFHESPSAGSEHLASTVAKHAVTCGFWLQIQDRSFSVGGCAPLPIPCFCCVGCMDKDHPVFHQEVAIPYIIPRSKLLEAGGGHLQISASLQQG